MNHCMGIWRWEGIGGEGWVFKEISPIQYECYLSDIYGGSDNAVRQVRRGRRETEKQRAIDRERERNLKMETDIQKK